tara:strand:+ start:485 stop:1834 length:1350 start_codon:yes stop_codon:yes gene_type:complete
MPPKLGTTTKAESAQALICSLADLLGGNNFEKLFDGSEIQPKVATYAELKKKVGAEKLKKSYNRIRIGGIAQSLLEKFLNDEPSWYESSMKIAREMINQIKTKVDPDFNFDAPGFQNMFYFRGDDDLMGTISELFKSANTQSSIANNQKKFGDINKWSPADMYFGSNKAVKDLKTLNTDPETKSNNLTFVELNSLIFDLIDEGELLPLSLKKVEQEKVIIEKVNFKRSDEEKKLANFKITGVEPYKEMKANDGKKLYKLVKVKNKNRFVFNCNDDGTVGQKGARDIYLTYDIKGGKPGRIQFRHTPASGGKPSRGIKIVIQITGTSALAGQIVGIPQLVNAIKEADKQFAQKIQTKYDELYKNFEKQANLYLEYGGGKKLYGGGKKEKDEFNTDFGVISGVELMNPLRVLLKEYFEKYRTKKVQNVGRAMFAYATSRSVESGSFVIVKD